MPLAALLLLAIARTALCACSVPGPIAVPITDLPLSNGETRRGVALSIGTPAQNFSVIPSGNINNTWIYNTTTVRFANGNNDTACDTVANNGYCITLRGGEYIPGDSTSATLYQDPASAGGDTTDTLREYGHFIWEYEFTTDVLTVGDNTSLANFPIGIPGQDFGGTAMPQNVLGMGANSTFLTALKDAGHISSRSYGYWWGLEAATSSASMDGQLVLGGYDAAKIMGQNYTFPLQPGVAVATSCPTGMWVDISDMSLIFPNGSAESLTSPNSLQACIQLDNSRILSFAMDPYFQRFLDLSETDTLGDSNGTNYNAALFAPDDVYPGSLQVSLSNGPSVTIPNDLLFVPQQSIQWDSGAITSNQSMLTMLVETLPDGADREIPVLGRNFLEYVYLFVDLDANTFTLWEANVTSDTNLVAVGGDCSSSTSGAQNTTAATNPSTATPASLSTGAIAGIAVGGVAVIALIVAVVFVLLRRRKRTAGKDYHHTPARGQGYSDADTKGFPRESQYAMQEMEGSGRPRQELPSDSRVVELQSGADLAGPRSPGKGLGKVSQRPAVELE